MVNNFNFCLPELNTVVANLFKKLGGVQVGVDSHTKPDLVVLTGGPDINPKFYSAPSTHFKTSASAPIRDYREISAVAAARFNEIPVIGICRGAQVLHVALGGTLIQDVIGHRSGNHEIFRSKGATQGFDKFLVNSTHHQAIPKAQEFMYDDVWASEADKDSSQGKVDIIEAFIRAQGGLVGMQFHPEYEATASKESVAFLEHIVKRFVKS